MACAAQSFNNVDQNVWNCLVSKVAAYGVTISQNSGSTSTHGFDISWNHDPGAKLLTIQVTKKPLLLPCSFVNGKIHDEVESCMQKHGVQLSAMNH